MSISDKQLTGLHDLLNAIRQRCETNIVCDDAKTALAAADDLLTEVKRLRANLAEAKFLLEGWEQVGNEIAQHIPEHYEASEGALMGIIADWAKDAAAVVEAAKKAGTEIRSLRVHLSNEARALVAAVDKVYPVGIDA